VPAALLEDRDLLALRLGDDLGRDDDLGGLGQRVAFAGEQDVAQLIVSPASPASFSTAILSPAATRYCLPPVRTTANMVFKSVRSDCRSFGMSRSTTKKAPRQGTESAPPLGEEPALSTLARAISPARHAGNPRRAS
jgi:hypothetical protein